MKTDAIISDCGQYRYMLTREWDSTRPACTFIGVNPSTADAKNDDPTIRRCVDFAKRLDCGALIMVNLFPYRATDPKELLHNDLVNGDHARNLKCIVTATMFSKFTIAAWGNNGDLHNAPRQLVRELKMCMPGGDYKLHRLGGLTSKRQPRHPLYLAKTTELQEHEQI